MRGLAQSESEECRDGSHPEMKGANIVYGTCLKPP